MPGSEGVALGSPEYRISDCEDEDVNCGRYDWFVAAPSDTQLVSMWIGWSIIFGLIACYVSVVFFGILVNKAVRKSPFNCYLIFLMIPDFTYTTCCTVVCMMNAINGEFWSPSICRWQSWFIVWGAGSNCWLNAVVAYEIRKMLHSSNIRKRYFPPTRKRVCINAAIVYIYCGILGLLGIVGLDVWPTRPEAGLICVPLPDDFGSELFFWLVFTPAFMVLPLMYVQYVVWDIWYHNLLPPKGKRRLLGIYFFRIVLVFAVMWFPVVLFFYVFHWIDPWVVWASSVWAHLQGFASSTVSLLKPDISKAVRDFITCRICGNNPDIPSDPMYNVGRSGFTSSMKNSARRLFGRGSSRTTSVFRSSRQGSSGNLEGSGSLTNNGPRSTEAEGSNPSRNNTSSGRDSSKYEEVYTDDLKQSEVTFEFLDEAPDTPEDENEAEGSVGDCESTAEVEAELVQTADNKEEKMEE